ncbi:unnamed protein product [Symbiodinium natans]|uniref:Uncharacterized protein n=1 Tax=Symbiodinium natans TaxID=878477 RepID=A0A812QHJ0_9DINO|nr:unnamed protein product [Symbiodinium natans]
MASPVLPTESEPIAKLKRGLRRYFEEDEEFRVDPHHATELLQCLRDSKKRSRDLEAEGRSLRARIDSLQTQLDMSNKANIDAELAIQERDLELGTKNDHIKMLLQERDQLRLCVKGAHEASGRLKQSLKDLNAAMQATKMATEDDTFVPSESEA